MTDDDRPPEGVGASGRPLGDSARKGRPEASGGTIDRIVTALRRHGFEDVLATKLGESMVSVDFKITADAVGMEKRMAGSSLILNADRDVTTWVLRFPAAELGRYALLDWHMALSAAIETVAVDTRDDEDVKFRMRPYVECGIETCNPHIESTDSFEPPDDPVDLVHLLAQTRNEVFKELRENT